ncbi:hypothetical protein [Xenorhabdus anantnagensis]|uniref:Uncharacterized protein n=1 Tax=Xenorhabdus anantnagensis TaxID=3025875 RepID=A0ABT5LN90_9GAMM|nr:hypothetical protein [Xenorhabdus anantnagensis]MDC9595882.1 hypothetical protein [Xenorhabdus anantnagensis]
MRNNIEYAITGVHDLTDPTDRYELENPVWDDSYPDYLAEECAEYYYYNEDWDSKNWPIEITVFNNGESLGVFSIELYLEPVFSATRKKQ